jgi:hypothetical protein
MARRIPVRDNELKTLILFKKMWPTWPKNQIFKMRCGRAQGLGIAYATSDGQHVLFGVTCEWEKGPVSYVLVVVDPTSLGPEVDQLLCSDFESTGMMSINKLEHMQGVQFEAGARALINAQLVLWSANPTILVNHFTELGFGDQVPEKLRDLRITLIPE